MLNQCWASLLGVNLGSIWANVGQVGAKLGGGRGLLTKPPKGPYSETASASDQTDGRFYSCLYEKPLRSNRRSRDHFLPIMEGRVAGIRDVEVLQVILGGQPDAEEL